MVIEPTNDSPDDVRFVMDVKELAAKMKPFMPRVDKKGTIMLSPEIIKQTRRRMVDADIQARELRNEHPRLVVDTETRTVT
jgi:hypothetical protein